MGDVNLRKNDARVYFICEYLELSQDNFSLMLPINVLDVAHYFPCNIFRHGRSERVLPFCFFCLFFFENQKECFALSKLGLHKHTSSVSVCNIIRLSTRFSTGMVPVQID